MSDPFRYLETRAVDPPPAPPGLSDPASDAGMLGRWSNPAPPPQYVSAVEVAAFTWSSALAVSDVTPGGPRTAGLTPALLAWIGRALVTRGEALLLFRVEGGEVRWYPIGTYDIEGDGDPRTWLYRLDCYGPTRLRTYRAGSGSVAHLRWASDAVAPWRGRGPLDGAALTASANAEVEALFRDVFRGPRGSTPVFQFDPGVSPEIRGEFESKLKKFAATNRGTRVLGLPAVAKLETMRHTGDVLGPNVQARADLERSILAACGVPIELVHPGDGGGMREAYRRWGVTVTARLEMIASELGRVAELPIELSARRLRAADVRNNLMAWRAGVSAGMDPVMAARIAGIDEGASATDAPPLMKPIDGESMDE